MMAQLSIEMILIGIILLAVIAIVGAKVLSTSKVAADTFENKTLEIIENVSS